MTTVLIVYLVLHPLVITIVEVFGFIHFVFDVVVGGYFCDGRGTCSYSSRDALVSRGKKVVHCKTFHPRSCY